VRERVHYGHARHALRPAAPHDVVAAMRSKEGEIQRSLLNGQARQHAAKCTR